MAPTMAKMVQKIPELFNLVLPKSCVFKSCQPIPKKAFDRSKSSTCPSPPPATSTLPGDERCGTPNWTDTTEILEMSVFHMKTFSCKLEVQMFFGALNFGETWRNPLRRGPFQQTAPAMAMEITPALCPVYCAWKSHFLGSPFVGPMFFREKKVRKLTKWQSQEPKATNIKATIKKH